MQKVEQVGPDKVKREVTKLRKLVDNLTDKCVEGYVENELLDPEFRVYQPPGVTVRGIKVRFRGLKGVPAHLTVDCAACSPSRSP